MKRHLIFYTFSFIILAYTVTAQEKHDFVWTLGAGPNLPDLWSGGNLLNFQNGNPSISYFDITYDMDNPVNMSDRYGNLQFYSSGCDVINHTYGVMENGDQISAGSIHNLYCDNFGWGYVSYQGILALPFPGDTNKYILLHSKVNTTNIYDSISVLYTVIDMGENDGLGTVTEKNIFLQRNRFSKTFTAVRHANGRDWWIVIPEELKTVYHFYLLDPHGLQGPFVQQPEPEWILGHYGNAMCAFSPDGSKFVRTGGAVPAAFRLYDFDRCTGILSNAVTLSIPDTSVGKPWACFSPNSRYLYHTNKATKVFQYDIYANDINASVELVGEKDDFISVWGLAAGPYAMAIGPDNRIYCTSANGVNVLHTIEYPDLPGSSCEFRPHSITLPATIIFLPPNQPNYRLYNIPASHCDTLGIEPPIVAFWRSEQDSLASSAIVNFTDLSYYKPQTWLWDFGDGTTETVQSPIHQYAPGTYTACLTVCNAMGACNTLCRDIQITAVGTYEGLNEGLAIRLVPNPASNSAQIQFKEQVPQDCFFNLYDLAGRLIISEPITEGASTHSIPLTVCPDGWYFVCITENGRVVARKKFAVVR